MKSMFGMSEGRRGREREKEREVLRAHLSCRNMPSVLIEGGIISPLKILPLPWWMTDTHTQSLLPKCYLSAHDHGWLWEQIVQSYSGSKLKEICEITDVEDYTTFDHHFLLIKRPSNINIAISVCLHIIICLVAFHLTDLHYTGSDSSEAFWKGVAQVWQRDQWSTCVCYTKLYVYFLFRCFCSLCPFTHPPPPALFIMCLSRIQMLYFVLFRCLVPPLQPGVYLWTVPMTEMTRGEGSQWLIKWGRIIKQNSFHLEKLVLCGSLLFCSFTLVKTTRRTVVSKASTCVVMAGSLNNKIKAVIREWMSQSCKRMGFSSSHF